MKKSLSLSVWMALVGFIASASAATITDNVVNATGNPTVSTVRFVPGYTRRADGARTVIGYPVRGAVDTNGNFSVTIVGGYYDTFFDSDTLPPLRIFVPLNDTNTYNLNQVAQLAVNASMFNGSNVVVTNLVGMYSGTATNLDTNAAAQVTSIVAGNAPSLGAFAGVSNSAPKYITVQHGQTINWQLNSPGTGTVLFDDADRAFLDNVSPNVVTNNAASVSLAGTFTGTHVGALTGNASSATTATNAAGGGNILAITPAPNNWGLRAQLDGTGVATAPVMSEGAKSINMNNLAKWTMAWVTRTNHIQILLAGDSTSTWALGGPQYGFRDYIQHFVPVSPMQISAATYGIYTAGAVSTAGVDALWYDHYLLLPAGSSVTNNNAITGFDTLSVGCTITNTGGQVEFGIVTNGIRSALFTLNLSNNIGRTGFYTNFPVSSLVSGNAYCASLTTAPGGSNIVQFMILRQMNTRNLEIFTTGNSGQNWATNWPAVDTNISFPLLSGLNPDLFVVCQKNSTPANLTSNFIALDNLNTNAMTNADIVWVSAAKFSEVGWNIDADNRVTWDHARNSGQAYWDDYSKMPSTNSALANGYTTDLVHRTTLAATLYGAQLARELMAVVPTISLLPVYQGSANFTNLAVNGPFNMTNAIGPVFHTANTGVPMFAFQDGGVNNMFTGTRNAANQTALSAFSDILLSPPGMVSNSVVTWFGAQVNMWGQSSGVNLIINNGGSDQSLIRYTVRGTGYNAFDAGAYAGTGHTPGSNPAWAIRPITSTGAAALPGNALAVETGTNGITWFGGGIIMHSNAIPNAAVFSAALNNGDIGYITISNANWVVGKSNNVVTWKQIFP